MIYWITIITRIEKKKEEELKVPKWKHVIAVCFVISNFEEDKAKVYSENFYIEKVHNLLDLYTQQFYILYTHPHS